MISPITPPPKPLNTARCLGSGTYEDGKWHWREGCDDCQRRYGWAGGWIEPPPIIAFECEYRIGPDEIVAQGEHAPGPKPLSPAAQSVRRNMRQIMYELHQRCRISISATDRLPIILETDEASLRAGIDSLCTAAIRALADQVAPSDAIEPRNNIPMAIECQRIRAEILVIATELENAQ